MMAFFMASCTAHLLGMYLNIKFNPVKNNTYKIEAVKLLEVSHLRLDCDKLDVAQLSTDTLCTGNGLMNRVTSAKRSVGGEEKMNES